MIHSELHEHAKLFDFRHENVEDKLKFWGTTKTSEYVSPKDGFYFMYNSGRMMLFSTSNEIYSYFASQDIEKKTKGAVDTPHWNCYGGLVNFHNKTITLTKASMNNGPDRMRLITDVKEFKDSLRSLKSLGITDDYKIKGTSAPYNGMTVGEAMQLQSDVDNLLRNYHPILYHGTSKKKYAIIEKEGLMPGKYDTAYVDLIPNYSEHNVYLATIPAVAEFYGKRQAKKDNDDGYVILKIITPDASKLLPDDALAHSLTRENRLERLKWAIKEHGSVAYKGRIMPAFISVLATRKFRS